MTDLTLEQMIARRKELYTKSKRLPLSEEESLEYKELQTEVAYQRYFKKEKRYITFEEKHGTRYFDASTPKLLTKALLKIIKERVHSGHWYDNECEWVHVVHYQYTVDIDDGEVRHGTMNLTNVPDNVDDKELRRRVRLQLAALENLEIISIVKTFTQDLSDQSVAQKIVDSNSETKQDAIRAYQFLFDRSENEYESVDFIYPESV